MPDMPPMPDMPDEATFTARMRAAGIPEAGDPVGAVWHPSGVPVFRFVGRMKGLEGDALIRILRPVWDELPGDIILDLEACEYMSSSTLGFLVNAALERFENAGQLYLCRPRREVTLLFAHMDVDQFFRIVLDVEAAVAQIARRAASRR